MTTLMNTDALRIQQPRTDEVRGGVGKPHDSVAQSLHFAAMLEALNDTGAASAEGEGLPPAAPAGPSPTRPAPDAQRVGAPMASLIAQGGFDALGDDAESVPQPTAGLSPAAQEAGQVAAGQVAVAGDFRWMAHLMAAQG
ncbi:hypothetical protein [Azospirillum sp.]|uniref:hypothetical protein n=1 Tax=Azospirillum sp. TaxID=34012 RepID=UPI002D60CBCE|nr:hypothetical protein [Azospirillum sp.]HYD65190.1 hypothetical protein [Azospirillum sp.]